MPDIEQLCILEITCEVIGDPPENIKFNLQITEALVAKQTEPHRTLQIKWMQIKLMQICQIISSPAPTEQQIKEEVMY